MKTGFLRRIVSLMLMLCLLTGASGAWADAPALRAYCHAFSVETSEGAVRGFGFKMGAQYGTQPYAMSYTFLKEGGSPLTGSVSKAGYISVPGAFGSGEYSITASVRDAAGAQSTAVMKVTFTLDENGNMSSAVTSSVAPQEVRVQEISLSVSAQTMRVGDTFALKASVSPADAKNKEVAYTSTDAGIASVDADGLVTAVKAGTCKVICTAKDGSGVTEECAVTVIQSVTGITLSPATLTIPVGGTYKLIAEVTPDDADNKGVTFVSGNKDVAVVANDGTVTGVDMGVVTVSVSAKDNPAKIATCVITVGTPVQSISLSPSSVELGTGEKIQLTASVAPTSATNRTLSWTSSDTDVATVDDAGKATVWKAGTAVITAAATDGSGAKDTCTVTAAGETVEKPAEPAPEEPEEPEDPDDSETEKAPQGETAYVRTEKGGLNLRTRTSSGAKRIKIIPQNDALTVINKGTTWCYVWHEGDYGYVMTKFLSIYDADDSDDDSSAAPPPANGREAQVDTEKGGLNLRTKPSQAASRIRVIPENAKFTVVTHGSTWCYAWYKGDYGYVMTKFVKFPDEGGTDEPDTPDVPDTPDMPDTPTENLYGIVTTKEGRLNLRKEPDTDADILKRIDPGKAVTVLSYGDKWCYVEYKSTKGYVMTKFLIFSNQKPEETPEQPPVSDGETQYAQVTTEKGSLNLRAGKSTSDALIKRIPQNVYVLVLTYGSDWCYVNYNGTKGYVMTKFLTFVSSVPAGSAGSTSTRPPNSNGQIKYAQVVTDEGRLNLRSDKSQNAAIIARIPQKTYVKVLSTGNIWCYVDYNGKIGYVMTKFLSFAKLAGSSEGLQPTLVKSSGSLYKEASISSAKLAEIVAGDYVYFYTDDGTWARVLHLGIIGYIKSECLKLREGVASVNNLKVYEDRTYSYENDSVVLATLNEGDTVKVLHCYGDTWWLVRLGNGIEGYVTTEGNVLKVPNW